MNTISFLTPPFRAPDPGGGTASQSSDDTANGQASDDFGNLLSDFSNKGADTSAVAPDTAAPATGIQTSTASFVNVANAVASSAPVSSGTPNAIESLQAFLTAAANGSSAVPAVATAAQAGTATGSLQDLLKPITSQTLAPQGKNTVPGALPAPNESSDLSASPANVSAVPAKTTTAASQLPAPPVVPTTQAAVNPFQVASAAVTSSQIASAAVKDFQVASTVATTFQGASAVVKASQVASTAVTISPVVPATAQDMSWNSTQVSTQPTPQSGVDPTAGVRVGTKAKQGATVASSADTSVPAASQTVPPPAPLPDVVAQAQAVAAMSSATTGSAQQTAVALAPAEADTTAMLPPSVAAPARPTNAPSSNGGGANTKPSSAAATTTVGTANGAANMALPSDADDTTALYALTASATKGDASAGVSAPVTEAAPVKVTVVAQTTHFAPVAELSPVQQIANVVLAEVGASGATSSSSVDAGVQDTAASAPAASVTVQSSAPVMRTLTLELAPESLGGVTISMRLAGSKLDVQVEAERAETTRLLDNNKDLLAGQLQATGYAVDALVIKSAPGGSHLQSDAGLSQGQGQDQASQNGTQAGASQTPQQGDGSGNDRASGQRNRQISTSDANVAQASTAAGNLGGDLYV